MIRAILEGRKTQTRRPVKYPVKTPVKGFTIIGGPPTHGLCPYGQPGQLLYVRETWAFGYPNYPYVYVHAADYPDKKPPHPVKWRPSIHMPFNAARIFLKITGVYVQPLNSIDEADAKAEGAAPVFCQYKGERSGYHSHAEGFKQIWQNIYGPDSWEKNPWVWVIEFERTEQP